MHQNPVLEELVGDAPDLTIILAHGRGQSPAEMKSLAQRLALTNVRFLFPEATDHTWYPKPFMAPLEENEPWLSAALEHYDSIISELIAEGTPPERLVVGGFSQGACLTAEFLAQRPRPYGGAIIWTGGLIGPPGARWEVQPALAHMPAYLTTSEDDAWVPPSRVRETAQWLEESGAEVTMKIFSAREHGVLDEETASARAMIERIR